VLGAYHQLWQIEKSFRMSKSDLCARPIYHHKRESIEAHLSIVMAALAVGRLVEQATGWSINRFVKALRPCRTITIQAGDQTVTAADPIPDDASKPSPNSAGTLRTKLARVRFLTIRRAEPSGGVGEAD
jgi:hypothetical protein